MRVPKRIGCLILSALQGGVVPRTGLGYISVGREREIESLLNDLKILEMGGAAFRIIMGNYGSGKTFLLQAFKENAIKQGYIVADVDLSPERNLIGNASAKRGLATYKELMANISIKSSPTGGALDKILNNWMNSMWMEAAQKAGGGIISGIELEESVNRSIKQTILEITSLVNGFDLATVLSIYWSASRMGDAEKKGNAIRWLRGEYTSIQAAKRELGVSGIVNDDNWFDYIKNLSLFFHKIGYKGFVVLIDEVINLYKCRHSGTRNKNYEKILQMYNDCLQGKACYLDIIMSGTPISITDKERGIYSYGALRSRLETREKYGKSTSFVSTVMSITQLNKIELIVLLEKILQIHQEVFDYKSPLTDKEILLFIDTLLKDKKNLYITPRSIIRDFIELISSLKGTEGYEFCNILADLKTSTDVEPGYSDIV